MLINYLIRGAKSLLFYPNNQGFRLGNTHQTANSLIARQFSGCPNCAVHGYELRLILGQDIRPTLTIDVASLIMSISSAAYREKKFHQRGKQQIPL